MEEAVFDAIVSDFYEAATGALSWDRALDKVQVAFNARTAALHSFDLSNGRMLSLHCGGPDINDAMLTYIRDFHEEDPRRLLALQRGPGGFGQWTHDHEHFDDHYRANNHFFQNWIPAYDMRYNANVVIGVGDTIATGFILELHKSRGPLDADERDAARRLGEHMKEALHAYERVRRMAAQALAGHTLLHAFPYPMWLIDEQRFIAFENQGASAETQREARVARHGMRLALTRARSDQKLTEQLNILYRKPHGSSATVDLRASAADPPTWLHLSLLLPGSAMGAFGDVPLVLATLFDPQHVSPLDPFALGNMFKLTPAEAKVAARLADGLTAEQIAQAHGVALPTVRTQIRQVIAKLGAERTADVVRLLRQGEMLWSSASVGDRAR